LSPLAPSAFLASKGAWGCLGPGSYGRVTAKNSVSQAEQSRKIDYFDY
jgi:hypothetical protein